MVSIDDLQEVVQGLFKKPIIGPIKSRTAEIRHLENRHDVLFYAESGPIWIKKYRRLVQNDMSTAAMVKIETRCRIRMWRTFEQIPWHVIQEPHATLQGVIIPSAIENRFSPYFIFFGFFDMQFGL